MGRNSLSKPSEGEKKSKVETAESKDEKKLKSVNTEYKEEKKSKSDSTGKMEEPTEKEKNSEREKNTEKPRPKISIPEKTAEKRSHNVASPKVETKKSPSVIKESSFFGDVLGDIMKEPPRKKNEDHLT